MKDDDAKPAPSDDADLRASQAADRQRRLNALSELARSATSAASGAPPSSAPNTVRISQTTPKRRLSPRAFLLAALAVVIVAIGVGAYVVRSRPQQAAAPAIPATLTIKLLSTGLYCPSGVSWSPDGGTIAAFVSRARCDIAAINLPVLALFNARTGALERTIDPYTLLTGFNVQTPYVQDVVWSQDGSTLIFLVGYSSALLNAVPGSGLLYVPLTSGSPRYVKGPAIATGGVIWNLHTGAPLSTFTNPLPSAATYSWSSDGRLTADTAPPTAPGHASLFRVGVIQPIQPITQQSGGGPDTRMAPITLMFLTLSTIVSADGEYAAMGAERGALLPPSSGSPTLDKTLCGFYYDLCDLAPLPPPDAGLAAVEAASYTGYTDTLSGFTVTQWLNTEIAYRPDGKELAAILPDAVAQDSATKRITLFDTSSGAQLGVVLVTEPPNTSYESVGVSPLSWSPTGKQLAYYDYPGSTITIWGGSSLPN